MGRKGKGKKAYVVKDNLHSTPISLPPTSDLPQPFTADPSSLNATAHQKTDALTQEPQISTPSPLKRNVILYDGEKDEIYEKVDTRYKITKVNISEIKGLPEHVHYLIVDPGFLSEIRKLKERGEYTWWVNKMNVSAM